MPRPEVVYPSVPAKNAVLTAVVSGLLAGVGQIMLGPVVKGS